MRQQRKTKPAKRGHHMARQWEVLKMIKASTMGVAVVDIMNELGMSRRTVYRDLAVLEQVAPVYSEEVRNTLRNDASKRTVWKLLKKDELW